MECVNPGLKFFKYRKLKQLKPNPQHQSVCCTILIVSHFTPVLNLFIPTRSARCVLPNFVWWRPKVETEPKRTKVNQCTDKNQKENNNKVEHRYKQESTIEIEGGGKQGMEEKGEAQDNQ